MNKAYVSKATLVRLPQYLDYLKRLPLERTPMISATKIAQGLKLGEVQVRKDLASVSGTGRPRLGYVTEELIEQIESCLGYRKAVGAVIVGGGKLGRALLHQEEFARYGVKIQAIFDSNEEVIRYDRMTEVLPMDWFAEYCHEHEIVIGVIAVGIGSAQHVCNRMVSCGIRLIWNLAPCKLEAPEGVEVLNENLALSLAYLSNRLHEEVQPEKGRDSDEI